MLYAQYSGISLTEIKDQACLIFSVFVFCIIISLFWGTIAAQEKGEWHCFHGLSRSDKSVETGLLKKGQNRDQNCSGRFLVWGKVTVRCP